jgi:hypothetical protein
MGTLNADGLWVKFGTEKTLPNRGGEYNVRGDVREIEVVINLPTLNQNEVVQSDVVFVPAGVRIQEVEVVTDVVAATGVAVDVGLVKTDRTTEIDFNGLLATFPLASMSITGEKNTFSQEAGLGTGGALIGTTTAFVGYITASATTATAFTTGSIRVRIRYYKI